MNAKYLEKCYYFCYYFITAFAIAFGLELWTICLLYFRYRTESQQNAFVKNNCENVLEINATQCNLLYQSIAHHNYATDVAACKRALDSLALVETCVHLFKSFTPFMPESFVNTLEFKIFMISIGIFCVSYIITYMVHHRYTTMLKENLANFYAQQHKNV